MSRETDTDMARDLLASLTKLYDELDERQNLIDLYRGFATETKGRFREWNLFRRAARRATEAELPKKETHSFADSETICRNCGDRIWDTDTTSECKGRPDGQ